MPSQSQVYGHKQFPGIAIAPNHTITPFEKKAGEDFLPPSHKKQVECNETQHFDFVGLRPL